MVHSVQVDSAASNSSDPRSKDSPVSPASSTFVEVAAMRGWAIRTHTEEGSTAATLVTPAG